MAIPFGPPPPDEYSLQRLHALVEELYVLIICHLQSNQQAVKPEPPKRRGPSCTDDEKNSSPNFKRDGGDSDSDPDACTAATTATCTSVFADLAADLDLGNDQRRRLPGDLARHNSDSADDVYPRPSGSGAATSCRRCLCQPGVVSSRGWRGGSTLSDAYASSAVVEIPQRNQGTMQESSGLIRSFLTLFRTNPLGSTLSATVACYIGYRFFCCTNVLDVFGLR